MSLIEMNFQPTRRQLRQFGGICLIALPALGWFWSGDPAVMATLGAVGLLLAAASWLVPRWILPLFIGLILVTVPIGMVVSEVAMFLIYVIVFLPIGILFRVVSRDRLQLKIDRKASTYWQPKRQPSSVGSYYRQS